MKRLALSTILILMASCLPDGRIDADGDGIASDEDCDDSSASIVPGADERCGDGIDQDCDGAIDEGYDVDGDGYLVCLVAGLETDCDDNNSAVNPEAEEVCGDGIDNNCDGVTDTEVDIYEPNNSRATAYFLGQVDNATLTAEPTVYLEEGPDLRDYFEVDVTEEDLDSDDFRLIVRLTDIPEGVDLDLEVDGPGGQSLQDSTPANSDEEVVFEASRFDDGGVYTIQVKLMSKAEETLGVSCLPYTLSITQEG